MTDMNLRFHRLAPRTLAALAACAAPLAFAAGATPGTAADAPVTVIKAGRLVDVAAGRVRENQLIVIQGERITAVGPADATIVPPGAKLIDLSQQTVLPGLIDTHTHVTGDPRLPPYYGYGISVPRAALKSVRFARETLLSGVTTIRDVGADHYADVALRDAINAGDVIGPRILASGPALGITGGHCDSNMLAPEYHETGTGVADGPWAVRQKVRENIKYGVDLIKYCGTGGVFSKGTQVAAQQFTPEEVAALVDEAHMHGRKVAVHAHGASGIKVALRAGVDTVEHASLIDDEGLRLAKEKGAFLSMDIYNSEYTQSEGPKRGELEEFLRKDREVAQVQRDNFRKAVQMGIKLTMGTDTGVHPHTDAPKQLAYMVEYGMTPMQALQAATRVGAEALGIDGDVGQISPGYSADIVAVTRDPLADIHAMDAIGFVMQRGTVYKQ
jgi:imidazolonepropionase-like amidohydrolase